MAFLHIPKAAGSSFGAILRAVLRGHQTTPLAAATPDAWAELPGFPDGFRLIQGHVELPRLRRIARQAHLVTVLRDPAERVASFYRFFRHRDVTPTDSVQEQQIALARRYTLEEWARLPPDDAGLLPYNSDGQVRLIAGAASVRPDREILARAIGALDRLAFVGLVERFADSMELFAATFGLPAEVATITAHLQTTGDELGQLDADTRSVIASRNKLDAGLYAAALRLFERRRALLVDQWRDGAVRAPAAASCNMAEQPLVLGADDLVRLLGFHGTERSAEGVVFAWTGDRPGTVTLFEGDLGQGAQDVWVTVEAAARVRPASWSGLRLALDGQPPAFATRSPAHLHTLRMEACFTGAFGDGLHTLTFTGPTCTASPADSRNIGVAVTRVSIACTPSRAWASPENCTTVDAAPIVGARERPVEHDSEAPPARPDPPLPPPELVRRVGSSGTDQFDLEGTLMKADLLEVLPPDWTFDGRRVLDFGCGSGRLVRQLLPETRIAEVWGTDIDAASIHWLETHLSPPMHVFRCGDSPPLPVRDEFFDLIFACSVFTHIAEQWSAWLVDLRRTLKPDGLLIASFLGAGMYEGLTGENCPEDEIGMNVLRRSQGWDSGGPCVLHSPWWLTEHWGRAFDILTIWPAGFASPRDRTFGHGIIVARKDARAPTTADLEALRPGEEREVGALRRNILQLHQEAASLRETCIGYQWLRARAGTPRSGDSSAPD